MRFRLRQLGLGMALMMCCSCAATAQSAVRPEIAGGLTLVESPKNPSAVTRAVDDLAADFAKVFGRSPKRVHSLAEAGPVALLISEAQDVPADLSCARTTTTESFA